MKPLCQLAVAAALAAMMTSCGPEAKLAEAARDFGEADAVTFVDTYPSMTMLEAEGYLLNVRANEQVYREEGHPRAADAYIEGFTEALRERSDSLASAIGLSD